MVCYFDYGRIRQGVLASMVRQVYKEFGHFDIRKIHSMLCGQHWWIGMYQQVALYVGRSEVVTGLDLALTLSHLNYSLDLSWD